MSDLLNNINCNYCPRNCNANRNSNKLGYCKSDTDFNVGSVCIHRGEEPVINGKSGICNVFFTRCNLQCIYCQNNQITKNKAEIIEYSLNLEQITEQIKHYLGAGCEAVGFVSPSHNIQQVKLICEELSKLEPKPIFVYNSNGYDKVETLKELEGIIDVYLPDLKYMDNKIAKEYSDAADYPQVATAAIKEMFRQKGSSLIINDNGYAEFGLIIRHLILPNHVENSLKVLQFIAEELSENVHVSLMSQYFPTKEVENHPNLGRPLNSSEYEQVVSEFERLGLHRGWIQELESSTHYRPDFVQSHPFEPCHFERRLSFRAKREIS